MSTFLILGLSTITIFDRMKISEFIMSYVRPNIPHDEPNAETQQAMRDVDEGKNLTRCNSIEEFWKIVGIDPNA